TRVGCEWAAGSESWLGCGSHRGGAPCMLRRDQLIRLLTSYRGGRMLLEAAWTDLVCRVAPRLITNLEEYPEAGLARLRMTRSRRYQVRGRGTGNYCDRKSAEGELTWPLLLESILLPRHSTWSSAVPESRASRAL